MRTIPSLETMINSRHPEVYICEGCEAPTYDKTNIIQCPCTAENCPSCCNFDLMTDKFICRICGEPINIK